MKNKKKLLLNSTFGGLVGIINGLLGAGGGLVCVPLLIQTGLPRKKAHANAVAVIFPITLVSAVSYLLQGRVQISDCLIYIPGGLLGALVGTLIMKKISPVMIRRIFGGFMVWAGWRLLFG